MKWEIKTLADIAIKDNGIVDGPFGSNLKKSDYIADKENGVPVLTTKNLHGDYTDGSVRYITKEKYEQLKRSSVFPGDILVAKIGSIGTCGIYPLTQRIAIIPANLLKITVLPSMDRKYVYYYILSAGFQKRIKEIATATAQPAFNVTKFRKLPIPVPPLEEQQRIVARIEELFSQLDDAEATLQKTKAQLALYNQAVLHSIFNTANGSKEYAIEEICESIVDCPHSTPKWVSHGKLCLRTTNFRRGYLDLSEPNYVSEETFERRNARLVPMPGDILYSREGAILGIACIIPEDTYVCLGQRMMLLRTNRKVLNKYLMYYLNSPAVTTLIGNKTGGSASPHINVGDIKKIRIPIPEFEQQEKLVAQIESRLSLCKEIEQTISILLLKLTSCKQSVLNTEIKGDDKNEQRNYRL